MLWRRWVAVCLALAAVGTTAAGLTVALASNAGAAVDAAAACDGGAAIATAWATHNVGAHQGASNVHNGMLLLTIRLRGVLVVQQEGAIGQHKGIHKGVHLVRVAAIAGKVVAVGVWYAIH